MTSKAVFLSFYLLIVLVFAIDVGLERDGDLSNIASLLNGDQATNLKLFTDTHCQEGNCFFSKLISILYPWIIGNPPGGDISFDFPKVGFYLSICASFSSSLQLTQMQI